MSNVTNDYTLCGNDRGPIRLEVFNYEGRPIGDVVSTEFNCNGGMEASIKLKPGVSITDMYVTPEMIYRRKMALAMARFRLNATYGLLTQELPKAVTKSYTTLIKKVIFNPPATIVIWNDDTKTVVKAQEDEPYDPEKGLAMCMAKRMYGDKSSYYDIFRKWLKTYSPEKPADELEEK